MESLSTIITQVFAAYVHDDSLTINISTRSLVGALGLAVLAVLVLLRLLKKPKVLVLDFAVHRPHNR